MSSGGEDRVDKSLASMGSESGGTGHVPGMFAFGKAS